MIEAAQNASEQIAGETAKAMDASLANKTLAEVSDNAVETVLKPSLDLLNYNLFADMLNRLRDQIAKQHELYNHHSRYYLVVNALLPVLVLILVTTVNCLLNRLIEKNNDDEYTKLPTKECCYHRKMPCTDRCAWGQFAVFIIRSLNVLFCLAMQIYVWVGYEAAADALETEHIMVNRLVIAVNKASMLVVVSEFVSYFVQFACREKQNRFQRFGHVFQLIAAFVFLFNGIFSALVLQDAAEHAKVEQKFFPAKLASWLSTFVLVLHLCLSFDAGERCKHVLRIMLLSNLGF